MTIAIHKMGSFSDRWIAYCEKNSIAYRLVNAYDSDIIKQVRDCDAFMWHHSHGDFIDLITAKRILFALQHSGIKVFPDFNTGWHFDDKVAQKYLLEAIDAPLVPSYVFYDKNEALIWARNTSYPKVFKLKGGAGSSNVKLVKSYNQCVKLIRIAFGNGFRTINPWYTWNEANYKNLNTKDFITEKLRGIKRGLILTDKQKLFSREKGYVYFQEFIPNNDYDTRIVVIGGVRAMGEKRFVRKGDFRASGSGHFSYGNISLDAVRIAFKIANRLKLQSVAFDFIADVNQNTLVVEMSYGFGTSGIKNCSGYWDSTLQWHEGEVNPEDWMVEDLIKEINA